MRAVRILIYEGSKEWLVTTMEARTVKESKVHGDVSIVEDFLDEYKGMQLYNPLKEQVPEHLKKYIGQR